MSAADRAPAGLHAAVADLADAEARYYATFAAPEASEADRLDAADNLDRAQNRARELTFEAPAPGAELVGYEVCSPDGEVISTRCGIEPAEPVAEAEI